MPKLQYMKTTKKFFVYIPHRIVDRLKLKQGTDLDIKVKRAGDNDEYILYGDIEKG